MRANDRQVRSDLSDLLISLPEHHLPPLAVISSHEKLDSCFFPLPSRRRGMAARLRLSARYRHGAQELLKNGNFEAPFPVADPTAGWALVFLDGKGGPGDFAIAGPSSEASTSGGGNGAHFRGNHSGPAFAYFKQVVTNLTPGAVYTLNIAKMKTGFNFPMKETRSRSRRMPR